jgi:ABC-type branched-subunit amino acid transport system ATPase component
VLADAHHWAKEIGLDDVPRQQPALVSDWRLRLAQWVRALVVQPVLLILEHPTRSAPESSFDRMRVVIEQVRLSGTAVLWISSDPRVLESVCEMATACYEISVGKMVRQNR